MKLLYVQPVKAKAGILKVVIFWEKILPSIE
jgi:hypothetical protein